MNSLDFRFSHAIDMKLNQSAHKPEIFLKV